MFLPFCFYVDFVFGTFLALLLSCFLFCFQSMKKLFPCNSGVLKLSWLKCSLFLMFNVLVLAFLFLMLSVCSLNNKVALFCVCVVCFLFC